jgi:hypothetical protein
MLGKLLRTATAAGPGIWVLTYLIAVTAVFATCVVITMRAALRVEDPDTREIAYRMFRDLLALPAPRRRD